MLEIRVTMSEGQKVLQHILQAPDRLRMNASALVEIARDIYIQSRRYAAQIGEM